MTLLCFHFQPAQNYFSGKSPTDLMCAIAQNCELSFPCGGVFEVPFPIQFIY